MTELTVQESCSACWLLNEWVSSVLRPILLTAETPDLQEWKIQEWTLQFAASLYQYNLAIRLQQESVNVGFSRKRFLPCRQNVSPNILFRHYCTYLCIYTSAVRVEQRILLPASARWRFTSPTLVWNVPTLQHYSDVIDYYEQPDLPATSVGHGTCRWKTVRTLSMSVALFGVHSLQMVYHWWVNLNIAAIITKWGLTESEMRRWRRSKNSMISMRFVDEIGQRRDLLHRRATDWQCHS